MIVATKFEVDMTIHCRVVAKFSKSRVWDKDKFQREVPFLEIPKFSYNTVWDRWKEAFVPKMCAIRPVVSM